MRVSCVVVALLFLASVLGHAESTLPRPRVAATYSSWPSDGYRYADSLDALYARLGWAYTRVENTQVADIVGGLDRFDIFCPPCLYNHDNPQPFERDLAAWRRFLERGGVLVALDANYGQMLTWVTQLGPGLGLSVAQCPEWVKSRTSLISVTAPDDPFAPGADARLPWAHTTRFGDGWKVLATCPDGNAVALRADVGQGVLIATNLYSDAGFPDEGFLQRVWAAQWPRLMDAGLSVDLDPGDTDSVGATRVRVSVRRDEAPVTCTARLELRHQGGQWQTLEIPVHPDGDPAAAELACTIGAGRTDLRLTLLSDGKPLWWTSWAPQTANVPAAIAGVRQRLAQCDDDLGDVPAGHALRVRRAQIEASCEEVATQAESLLRGPAGPRTRERWMALASRLAELEEAATILGGMAASAARAVDEGLDVAARGFVVVRASPLQQLHRDQAPLGPYSGPVDLQAARGEAESVQVGILTLAGELADVSVSLDPLRNEYGELITGDALELFRVAYVHLAGPSTGAPREPSWWPDPLLPADGPFDVRRVCQPVWLDVFVPEQARPGLYEGALTVRAGTQEERVPIRLRVHDFALPREHSLRQLFVFRAALIAAKYGLDAARYDQLVPVDTALRLAEVCWKRRIGVHLWGNEGCPTPTSVMAYVKQRRTDTGWEFDFSEADRIWQRQIDWGMRTLCVGFTPGCGGLFGATKHPDYWTFLEAYLTALVPHLRDKGWLDYAVWYMVDECWEEEAVLANLRLAELMDRVAPQIKRLMTAPRDPRLIGKAHIYVPGGMPDAHPQDAETTDRLNAWRDAGAQMWWYICCGPTHPYPNFFVDYPSLDSRMVFWLTWKYHKTGFLYWGVEYHGDPREMTADGPTQNYSVGPAHMGNGDGSLCYWGPDYAFYPSVRLNAIRDGIEDYEYFCLLRRLADEAERAGRVPDLVAQARRLLTVDERVLRITEGSPNFTYTLEPADLLAARDELARVITGLWHATGRT